MVSEQTHSNDPKAPPDTLTVDKQLAAKGQLEAAIILWLNYESPMAIHTLAVAAHDCFHAMGFNKGKPSEFQTWLSAQPRRFQNDVRDAQNFFKHGFKDLKGRKVFSPFHGEVLMFDSVVCHEIVLGPSTPLMRVFALRVSVENMGVYNPPLPEKFDKDKFTKLDRIEFANHFLPAFQADAGRAYFPAIGK